MDRASGRERATRAMRSAWRVSTPYRSTGQALSADPLGTGASFAEAASGENEPGVPVAFGWQLGLSGVQIPVVPEPGGLPFGKTALVGARGRAALVLGQRFNMGGDGVYTVDAGECGESFNVHSDYVSGCLSSSECDG